MFVFFKSRTWSIDFYSHHAAYWNLNWARKCITQLKIAFHQFPCLHCNVLYFIVQSCKWFIDFYTHYAVCWNLIHKMYNMIRSALPRINIHRCSISCPISIALPCIMKLFIFYKQLLVQNRLEEIRTHGESHNFLGETLYILEFIHNINTL